MANKKDLSLKEKLLCIQKELKAPKNQFNSYGEFYYRSCEDILEAVKPLLYDYGVALTINDEVVNMGDRYYIKSTAILLDAEKIDSIDNMITNSAYAREALNKKGMDDSQITGTASSYARKYALNGLFLIDDTKDADTDEHRKQAREAMATEKQIELIKKLSKDPNTILTYYNVKKLEDLTSKRASEVITKLKGGEKE